MNSWPYNFFKSYTSWNLALRYFRLTPTPEAVSNPSQMGRLTAHIFRVQASARSCTLEPVLASRREQGPTSHHVKVAPHTAWQGRQNSNYFTASNSFNSWIWCIFGAALYARCVTAWKRRDTTLSQNDVPWSDGLVFLLKFVVICHCCHVCTFMRQTPWQWIY